MNRGANIAKAIPHSSVLFTCAVLGNTTSAPTVPADGQETAASSKWPLGANGVDKSTAGIPTRTSTGIYTVTYAHQLAHVVPAGSPSVISGGSAPTTALYAIITSIVPATRVVTVKVYAPGGTLTDLGTSDMLVIPLMGYDTNKPA